MDIYLVRVPQDVDVVNVSWKAAKWGERPTFFSVHVDSYDNGESIKSVAKLILVILVTLEKIMWFPYPGVINKNLSSLLKMENLLEKCTL